MPCVHACSGIWAPAPTTFPFPRLPFFNAWPRRFPRLVRVRDDKGPEDSTSPEQVAEMYRAQAVLQQQGTGKADADDEY